MSVELPESYRPSENEEYMNSYQLEYFKKKLIAQKAGLLKIFNESLAVLSNHDIRGEDLTNWEYGAGIELDNSERIRKLIIEIDNALKRIENGSYGYCDATGDEIGILRLEVTPTTLYCIEEQERREKADEMYGQ